MVAVNVVIINLLCRKSRRKRILKLASALAKVSALTEHPIVSVSLLEAVDGVSQSFPELERRYGIKPFANWTIEDSENRMPNSWRFSQTSGGIASGLSHLHVAALGKEGQVTLVMEDDCSLTCTPDSAYKYFVQCLDAANMFRPDWDMLMLGAAGHRVDIAPPRYIEGTHDVEDAGFSYLTTMYWLSPEGAAKLTRNTPVCLENMLAFDELHNALAGLTGKVRQDVAERFSSVDAPLVLLSSTQSLVRQDPHDCVHDTNVMAKSRKSVAEDDEEDDVDPPEELVRTERRMSVDGKREDLRVFETTFGDRTVLWYRRRSESLADEEVQQQLITHRRSKKKHVVEQGSVADVEMSGDIPEVDTMEVHSEEPKVVPAIAKVSNGMFQKMIKVKSLVPAVGSNCSISWPESCVKNILFRKVPDAPAPHVVAQRSTSRSILFRE